MHIPVTPRDEYRGRSGNGDWADCLLQLDGDFGELLDTLSRRRRRREHHRRIRRRQRQRRSPAPPRHGWLLGGFVLHRHGGVVADAVHCALARSHRSGPREQRNHACHRLVHHIAVDGRPGCPGRPDHRREGSNRVSARRARDVQPGRLHLLERRADVRGEVAALQTGDGPTEVHVRPRAAARLLQHHQPHRRPEGTRTDRAPLHAQLDVGALHANTRRVSSQPRRANR